MKNRRQSRTNRNRFAQVEQLEDRRVLAVVTSLADAGAGSLRDALAGPDPSITFAVSGTINLTSGELAVTRNVTIDGVGQSVTVNNTVAGNRVFNIDDGDGTANLNVTISNLTITGGSISPTDPVSISGGGIRNAERLTLTDSSISGNSAGIGGGVGNVADGVLDAADVRVTQNSAYYSGGGVSVAAAGSATMTDSTVDANTVGTTNASTYSSFGGGLFNAGVLTVSGSTISNNSAKHTDVANRSAFGGGVASTGTASTTISNTTIQGNRADELGGGLSGSGGATTHVLTNVTLDNNYAGLNATGSARGGAMYLSGVQNGSTREVAQVTITGGAVTNNRVQNGAIGVATTGLGGGLFLSVNIEGTIDGTDISNNTAFSKGGGVWLGNFTAQADAGAYSNVTIQNATISGNSIPNALNPSAAAIFPYGGGVYQSVNVELDVLDSTVSNNTIGESNTVQGNARGAGLFARAINGTAPARFSRLTVRDSMIQENVTKDIAASGGGIHLSQGAQAVVQNSVIEDNLSDGGNGGGIAMLFDSPSVTVEDSIIRNNTASDDPAATTKRAYGGAVAANVGAVTIRRSEITGNTGDWGGALALRALTGLIQDSNISNNTATGDGGGVEIRRRANLVGNITIENSTLANNITGTLDTNRGGGGLASHVYSGSETGTNNVTIRNTTIANNQSALDGGAVESVGTNLVMENVTMANNVAGPTGGITGNGGAVWFTADAAGFTGSFDIRFSTISQNTAMGLAGGLFNDADTFSMNSSIVSGNMAPNYLDVSSYYGSIKYSLVEDSSGNNAAFDPSNVVGMSANLGALANNGGPTMTMMPNAGSPALDVADPAATLAVDQRGYSRPGANATRDMGAVERDGLAPTIDGDFNDDGLYDCLDMNALTTAVATGGPVALFDLTGDGMLTIADMDAWRLEAGEANIGPGRAYKPGDANLDGVVDGSDFGLWNSAKFTSNTNWCNGNFNGDMVVDGSDFGIWNGNKFTSSDAGRGHVPTTLTAARRTGAAGTRDKVTDTEAVDRKTGAENSAGEFRARVDGGSARSSHAIPFSPTRGLNAPDAAIRESAFAQFDTTPPSSVPWQLNSGRVSTPGHDRIARQSVTEDERESLFARLVLGATRAEA